MTSSSSLVASSCGNGGVGGCDIYASVGCIVVLKGVLNGVLKGFLRLDAELNGLVTRCRNERSDLCNVGLTCLG